MKIRKPIFAFIILFVLEALMIIVTTLNNLWESNDLVSSRNALISKNVVSSLKAFELDYNRSYDLGQKKTEAGVKVMVYALQNFVHGKNFTGPRIFEDGVVVQVNNDEVLYPDEFDYRFEGMSPDYLKTQPSLEVITMTHKNNKERDKKEAAITVMPISEDFWYVDWTDRDEYNSLYLNEENIASLIEDIEHAFDGYLLLFDKNTPDMKVFYASSDLGSPRSAEDMGFTREEVESELNFLMFFDKGFSATHTSIRLFRTSLYVLILLDTTGQILNLFHNTVLILLLILLLMTGVIFWLYWIQVYVRDNEITAKQRDLYKPGRVRRVTRSIAVVGVLVIFVVSISVDSLGNFSLEAATNNRKLSLIDERMVAYSSMQSDFREDVESWAVYYAERLSHLLSSYPELRTSEFLQHANEQFDSDFIMLFDNAGQEVVSSNNFVNLNLMEDLSADGSDFEKLLKGAPSMVNAPEEVLLQGKETQLVGVSVDLSDDEGNGALILSIDPEKTWRTSEKKSFSSFIDMITPSGNETFVVDNQSGTILFSGDKEMIGKNAQKVGLYKSDAVDTEFDMFRLIRNQQQEIYYGSYKQAGPYQYYYLTFADIFHKNTFPFAAGSTIGFLIIYWIVTSFMLHPYKKEVFNETVRITKTARTNPIFDQSYNAAWAKLQSDSEDRWNILNTWKKLPPNEKSVLFLRSLLGLVLLISAILLLSPSSIKTRSAIDFILMGTWRRGINIMAFAGILILVVSFCIFVLFKNLLLTLTKSLLDRKAETIIRLTISLIQYAAIIALLYFSFGFLGFDTRALLASVSFLSLAVTLGAKDLVADILAGIFIVFEDDFNVGDIIEVEGFSGIVQEIGVRSTKVIGIGDDVKIFGNQSVKNVLNMSKMNSWYSLNLRVPFDQPITEIEQMLIRELPAIGEAIPEIISGPYYKGIMSIEEHYTLYIIAECRQESYRKIQRELNHAIIMLFKDNGYRFV